MSPERRDAIVAFSLSLLLAVALTWPMAARLGSAGRVDSGDGRHGVWNVSWVAHALTTSPSRLYDATAQRLVQGAQALQRRRRPG